MMRDLWKALFLVIGIVYSILPHYLPFWFIFLVALSLRTAGAFPPHRKDASVFKSGLGSERVVGSGGLAWSALSTLVVAAE